jgi:glycerol uptake facilitator-like aquaporin
VLLLTFFGVGTAVSNPGDATAASLEAGFFIGCAIRILNTVSGGHVNPAISVGFVVLGQITLYVSYFTASCRRLDQLPVWLC